MFTIKLSKLYKAGLLTGFFLLAPLVSALEPGVYVKGETLQSIRSLGNALTNVDRLVHQYGMEDWDRTAWGRGLHVVSRESVRGDIPVLCLHKIGPGEGQRYILSSERTHRLFQYFKENGIYVISDQSFLRGDFSEVPTGMHPLVIGSDDATYGNIIYESETGEVLSPLKGDGPDDWTLKEDCLADIIMDEMIRDRSGRYPFTFYVSFDGIPFRQTGGFSHSSAPYTANPVVRHKVVWALENFYLGYHSFSHPVTSETPPEEFLSDMKLCLKAFYDLIGNDVGQVLTLAYPYGCQTLNPVLERLMRNFRPDGVHPLLGAFDFDGYFSDSPRSSVINNFDVSRLGVDNYNFSRVLGFLDSVPLAESERIFVLEPGYNFDDGVMKAGEMLYVLQEKPNGSD